uniref:SFRICE_032992 n=1 Tax=Spodoptera frugiperda TaxID=7108 RepID=A0A2H1VLB0_SPOFR
MTNSKKSVRPTRQLRPSRERSWSLEECSICFDVMLRNQDLTSLPCTHNFHTDCIMPWLQEKQTCPNCRKVA